MRYHTQFQTSPAGDDAGKLERYVAGNAETVVTPSGLAATDRDLDLFAKGAAASNETRMHTVTLTQDFDADRLADRAIEVCKDCDELDTSMIGIHPGESGNTHIHIAEYSDQERGTDFSISKMRESLEKHIDDPPAWS
jgi:hypothetical protein